MNIKLPSLLLSIAFGGTLLADTAFESGAWRVKFIADGERLEIENRQSAALVSGKLSFTGPAAVTGSGVANNPAETAAWKVADSRDGAANRLALVDTRDNVNGYITFQCAGNTISLLVYHRTAFAYGGELRYQADISYHTDAFGCRLTPKSNDRVLSIKSGPAISADDDALFSPSRDEALLVKGAALSGRRLSATLNIDEPTNNAISLSVIKNYFKDRWVPYFRPLDRQRAPHAPTGWLSWNTYFDKATAKDNLDEARFAAKWFKPFGMEIWNIESWQDESDSLPVSKFHNMNLETNPRQFPEGMKHLADEIRKLGFIPGLWMAPYGTGNEAFYKQHKDWFLHDKNGNPIHSWNGIYTLDPTAPGALEHLTKIFDKASHEWGYEFFKIDGMSGRGPGYCAHMYERPDIKARFHDPSCKNPFEKTVAAFRKGIGDDRIFLACQGHFTGAEAGYADASRTGADIVHPNQPVKWSNILLQARCTINQIFAHSIVFWSDPDCMLVSQGALEREQAQVEATVVALPGQQTFAGDKLALLAPDRVRLIQQALPVCETRPAKLYPQFGYLPVWDLHIARHFGSWHVVALFNWDDSEKEIALDWNEIGENPENSFIAWEFWNGKYLGSKRGGVKIAVPPRSVRLIALHQDRKLPQFLSSDRHITQGGVDLKDEKWNGTTLTATLNAIGGFPSKAVFRIPGNFKVSNVRTTAEDASIEWRCEGEILYVTLASKETRDISLQIETSMP